MSELPDWLKTLESGFVPALDSGALLTLCWGNDCPGDGRFSVPIGGGRAQHVAVGQCRCWQRHLADNVS